MAMIIRVGLAWLIALVMGDGVCAEPPVAPLPDKSPVGEDLFSRTHERALTVSATYTLATNTLMLTVTNVTSETVRFNEPVLVSGGNIYISGVGISYPPLGSGIYVEKPVTMSGSGVHVFAYVLDGGLQVKELTSLQLDLYLDGVNGEIKRTHYHGTIQVMK